MSDNKLPRPRVDLPGNWEEQVASINPLVSATNGSGWVCLEVDRYVVVKPGHLEGVRKPLPIGADCPICLKRGATKMCAKCESVYYCSKTCQSAHWRDAHKKACIPNPKLARFNTDVRQFRSLDPAAFEGHEFLTIKPTGRFESLAEICDQCLENADDIMDIPGFGHDQIQSQWAAINSEAPLSRALQERFGWTSGAYGVELMEGYRMAEDFIVYMVLCDDSFLNQRGLETSYYGGACFPYAYEGKDVRGNLVIFRLAVKNKEWRPMPSPGGLSNLIFEPTDDSNLTFEYEMFPVCKAEVAHMLQERRRAMDNGSYTRRLWRTQIRRTETQIESKKRGDLAF